MRMTFFIVTAVTALAVALSAATLLSTPISGGCVYADKAVKLGETLVVDQDVVLVCASAPQGAVFYPLAQDGVQRVLKAIALPST